MGLPGRLHFDIAEECHSGDACCHGENYNTDEGGDCTAPGVPATYFQWPLDYDAEDFASRTAMTARALMELRGTDSELSPSCVGAPCDASTPSTIPHGVWLDDTTTHDGGEETEKVRDSCIEGVRLEDYVANGLDTDADTVCVDIGGGLSRLTGTAAPWGSCPSSVITSAGCSATAD